MKKFVFLFILVSSLYISENVNAQCKFKETNKYARFVVSDNGNINPDVLTKEKIVLNKGMGRKLIMRTSFLKSGEDYFLFVLLTRGYSSNFEILENNPLVLIPTNGNPVSLLPCGDFNGKKIMAILNIGCYYKVTKEQLEQIANFAGVSTILMHFTSDKDINGSQIDEDGSLFFKYDILSNSNSKALPATASCILTK